jgi:hypothetical protein
MAIEKDETGLPKTRLWQPITARWFFTIFGLCLAYAVIRYHLVKDVSWEHFPLFILNKVTAMAAVFFVGSSYLIGKGRLIGWYNQDVTMRLVVVKFCGLMGFVLAGVHAFMSFALLTPHYFAKYHAEGGKLNLTGELGIALGILGLWCLLSPAVATLPMMQKELGGKRWKRAQHLGYVALVFTGLHLVVLGQAGWLNPGGWSYLPPISLIAFAGVLITLLFKLRRA